MSSGIRVAPSKAPRFVTLTIGLSRGAEFKIELEAEQVDCLIRQLQCARARSDAGKVGN